MAETLEKSFWSKTKVKVATAHALAALLVTFAKVLLDQNGMPMSEEVYLMLLGAITTVALTVLGAHTVTDTAATKEKIKMTGTLSKSEIVKSVAKEIVESRLKDGDQNP